MCVWYIYIHRRELFLKFSTFNLYYLYSNIKEQLAEPADYEKRYAVYRKMLKLLKLSYRYKEDLRRRGLTEEEISRMERLGYKSTRAEDSVAVARRFMKSGCNLRGVPGFFVNRNGDWELWEPEDSYGNIAV